MVAMFAQKETASENVSSGQDKTNGLSHKSEAGESGGGGVSGPGEGSRGARE